MVEHEICKRCGGAVGTSHIHQNLHTLFDKYPELKDRYNHTEVLLAYWQEFNGFGTIDIDWKDVNPNESKLHVVFPVREIAKQLEYPRSIDREERNVIPVEARGKKLERDYRTYYAGVNQKGQNQAL